jgi:hypothetical protein
MDKLRGSLSTIDLDDPHSKPSIEYIFVKTIWL